MRAWSSSWLSEGLNHPTGWQKGERLHLNFIVETGNDPLEFRFLLWLNLRKLDSKCPGFDPSYLSLIDSQRPVKPGDIDAALKCSPHDNRQFRFNHTATGREVQRPTLAFSLPA